MRTRVAFVAVLAVALSSCGSSLGRSIPVCGPSPTNTTILAIQSVPRTEYVACIEGLKTGWSYNHLQARNGQSVFTLDSDRIGEGFVEVLLEGTCDHSSAVEVPSDETPVRLFQDVEQLVTVPVVVVPEGQETETALAALGIAVSLDGEMIKDRTIEATRDNDSDPTLDRIRRARAGGAYVLVVTLRDVEEETVTLLMPGVAEEIDGLDLDDALDEIEDDLEPPSYHGRWYYPFESGCVTYTFDAEGPGVETLEDDIMLALGLFEAEPLRRLARELGYDVP